MLFSSSSGSYWRAVLDRIAVGIQHAFPVLHDEVTEQHRVVLVLGHFAGDYAHLALFEARVVALNPAAHALKGDLIFRVVDAGQQDLGVFVELRPALTGDRRLLLAQLQSHFNSSTPRQ